MAKKNTEKNSEYNKKRDFKKTLEPKEGGSGKNIYVIQEHHATHLHYDLRLEIKGALKSWAVPKGMPEVGERKLAVLTEDHPLSYANFSGVIPEGNYGAGKVIIWDKGTFQNMRDISIEKSFEEGKIEVFLSGQRLNGSYALVKTNFGKGKNWLLLKMK